jgi:hypothetical protein
MTQLKSGLRPPAPYSSTRWPNGIDSVCGYRVRFSPVVGILNHRDLVM